MCEFYIYSVSFLGNQISLTDLQTNFWHYRKKLMFILDKLVTLEYLES